MKKVFLLFVLITAHLAVKGQDYYILKKSNDYTELYSSQKEEIRKYKDAKKGGSRIAKPDGLKELNRLLLNDESRVQAVQLAFGRGDINGQLYSNLIKDVFTSKNNKYLGEISLGSVVSNTTASDKSESQDASNINNFFNGGGNIFLKYVYLLPAGYTDGYDNFTFVFAPSFRVASNLPKLSQSERLEDWNMELASEATISLNGRDNNLGVFLKPKLALAWGSKNFAESILKKSAGKSFGYLQLQAAVKVSEGFLINIAFKPLVNKDRRSEYFDEKQFSTIGIQALIK